MPPIRTYQLSKDMREFLFSDYKLSVESLRESLKSEEAYFTLLTLLGGAWFTIAHNFKIDTPESKFILCFLAPISILAFGFFWLDLTLQSIILHKHLCELEYQLRQYVSLHTYTKMKNPFVRTIIFYLVFILMSWALIFFSFAEVISKGSLYLTLSKPHTHNLLCAYIVVFILFVIVSCFYWKDIKHEIQMYKKAEYS